VLPARLTDAALPAPSAAPDRPPASATDAPPRPALVAAPSIDPVKDGEFILYQGGTPDEQLTRLVIDVTLSDATPPARDAAALARWSRTTPEVRAWLADRVDTDKAERRSEQVLAIRRERFESERERARPDTRTLGGLGTIFHDPHDASEAPVFEKVRCGAAAVGDRLLSAQWQTPGYGGGSCDAGACAEDLPRGLAKAQQVGESTTVRLSLSHAAPGSAPARVDARCKVGVE
jgi:hypothetical protein